MYNELYMGDGVFSLSVFVKQNIFMALKESERRKNFIAHSIFMVINYMLYVIFCLEKMLIERGVIEVQPPVVGVAFLIENF